jgi:N-formylglutamate deformylase
MSNWFFPYNRIFCDVERLPDEMEPQFVNGRGFYYTKTDDGHVLREENEQHKAFVFEKYYKVHHQIFEQKVQDKLDKIGFVNIVDCHSFSDVPFISDFDKFLPRPDVCIGVDEFHTPKSTINELKKACDKFEFSFKINEPYVGTIVPLKFYQKEGKVKSIMIEINRKLYMNNGRIDYKMVAFLNSFVQYIFSIENIFA